MNKRSRLSFTVALGAAVFGLGMVQAAPASAQLRNCVDTLAGMREFSRFTNGIVMSHVVGTMRAANAITIFAPTDDALRSMNPMLLDRLFPAGDSGGGRQADNVLAPAAIGAHVVEGKRDAAALAQGGQFTSVAGTPLNVTNTGGRLSVAGAGGATANVTRTDIQCANGVIHAIDAGLVR